jgi:protein-disulfide isomerase
MTSSPTSRKQSRRHRRQQEARSNLTLMGVVIRAVVGVGFLLAASDRNTSRVTSERLEHDPILANPNALVTIVEYGAYGCSACRA